jgi:DNA invertase Pin-like site-specific DNA recombinase
LIEKREKSCNYKTTMLIGYARVSTPSQSLDLQIDALVQAGCDKNKIFTDIASGSKTARPGLDKALDYARAGDILVVWKLDRLGRSLGHLIEVVRGLSDRGIGFKSIQESLDTTTSGGRLIFHVFGAIAEFERDLIRERTNAGLEAARARGKKGGRKRVLTDKQISVGKSLAADKSRSVGDICETLKISPATYYRYIHQP